MERIDAQNEDDRNIAHAALTWVANAMRLLKVSEIQVALAIEPGTRRFDNDNLLDIEMILSVCAGLIIVDEQLSVVRLVHYTAQEYVDSVQAQRFHHAQTEITCTILVFPAFEAVGSSWGSRQSPSLLEYSQYSLIHAAEQSEYPLMA